MVAPQISWDEGLDATQDANLARATFQALIEPMHAPEAPQRRLYAVVPTPAPDAIGQARWIAAAQQRGSAAEALQVIGLPRGGCCFVCEDAAFFEHWLPWVFRAGPPEITLLAINGDGELDAALIQALLRGDSQLMASDRAGLHFDSGDLFERF